MSLQDKPKKNKKPIFSLKFLLYDFVKITGAIPALIWIKPRITYENAAARKRIKGGGIIISNHTGFTDPVKLHCAFWYRRFYLLAIKDLFYTKLKNFFFTHMLCLPVDKENFSMNTLNAVADVTQKGYFVGIYPEGRIVRDEGSVGDFKGGAVMMALRSGVPIIPVYCLPYKGFFSFTDIIIGEPIDVKALCGPIPSLDKIEEVTRSVRDKELELIQIYNDRRKKK
ncbi:MAG: lysophospholipid acyltransferase family protein [Butyrivibrio sp.]